MILMCLALCAFSTAAMAERMKGAEVAALMAAGPLEFEAGSVGSFGADGSFTFSHTTYDEAGTFKIFKNGNVDILDKTTGKKVRFHFVRGSDGRPALVYAKGGGKQYPLKK
jgi:hypothetical protein